LPRTGGGLKRDAARECVVVQVSAHDHNCPGGEHAPVEVDLGELLGRLYRARAKVVLQRAHVALEAPIGCETAGDRDRDALRVQPLSKRPGEHEHGLRDHGWHPFRCAAQAN
jgi:hypothetical protein